MAAGNWDADSDIDGLEFYLAPKDTNGNMVKAAGNVQVKLWKLECTETMYGTCMKQGCTKSDSSMVENWNFQLTADNYGIIGAQIRTDYENYSPTNGDIEAVGCAEVFFTTEDGKTFSSQVDYIYMAG
jgi:hypothetical protein